MAEALKADQPKLLINLSEAGILDSSALGSMVSALIALRKGNREARLILTGVSEGFRAFLTKVKLDRIFDVLSTEEALGA